MPTGSKAQPDELNEALTKAIRGKMGPMGYNITALADASNIPRPTLSNILNNKKDPEFSQIQRIAGALKMRVSKLMAAAEAIRDGKDPF